MLAEVLSLLLIGLLDLHQDVANDVLDPVRIDPYRYVRPKWDTVFLGQITQLSAVLEEAADEVSRRRSSVTIMPSGLPSSTLSFSEWKNSRSNEPRGTVKDPAITFGVCDIKFRVLICILSAKRSERR